MVGVAAKHSQLLSLHNIPQPHGVVGRTRRQPSAIGTEREPIDAVGVPLQRFYIPPADRIPEANRAAVVGSCQPLAIRAEIDGVHGAAIPCHHGNLPTCDGIPESGRITLCLPDAIRCRDKAAAVGAEGDPGDGGGVALQESDRSARIRVPDPCRLVGRAGDASFAIRAERHRRDAGGVPAEHGLRLARGRIPDAAAAVVRAGHEEACIRTEG